MRVVITGGTSGMGRAAVKLFLKNGCQVVCIGINQNEGETFIKELKEAGYEDVYFMLGDVSKDEDMKKLYDFTIEKIGGCDSLINNAGIFSGGPLHETKSEDWDKLFNVDVKSIYLSAKYFVPDMLNRKKGSIVNTASVSGLAGDYNAAAYCGAKGAVVNLTRSMALDYAEKGIRVNAVCPGATLTPMFLTGATQEVLNSFNAAFPAKRMGTSEEVAEVMYFLASDKASWIMGANIPVSGGLEIHTGQPRQDKTE